MKLANGTRFEILSIAGLLSTVLSIGPVAAMTGYSIFDDRDLMAIDLATGAREVVGTLAIGTVAEVAFDGDDLFIIAQTSQVFRLYRIDLESAAESLVGTLGSLAPVTGLTFDADGILWMATTTGLYTVDPTSAMTTLIGTPDRSLLALAARDGELFGLTATDFTADLVTIDRQTATTSVLATMPEIFFSGGLLAGLAFDLDGSLWAYAVTLPPIEPHILLQTFYEIGDPADPQPDRSFSVEAPFIADPPLFSGLVVATVVFDGLAEIPTLQELGGTILAALLLGAGWMALRRRPVAL